jgi:hypothetical protein
MAALGWETLAQWGEMTGATLRGVACVLSGMRINAIVVISTFFWALFSMNALARPVGPPLITSMVEEADLIIVGRVGQFKSAPPPTAGSLDSGTTWKEFSLSVDRLLKNKFKDQPSQITVKPAASHLYVQLPSSGDYGIFCLNKAKNGTYYTPVDSGQDYVMLPALPSKDLPAADPKQPLFSIAQQLARILAAPSSTLSATPGLASWCADEYVSFRNGKRVHYDARSAQHLYSETAQLLKFIPYEACKTLLVPIAQSGELNNRLWAISCLVHHGNGDYLTSIQATLLAPPDAVMLPVSSIEGELANLKSPNLVPLMVALLGASDQSMRGAAARCLRSIGTEAAAEPLARLALYDKDIEVRGLGMMGLADITEQSKHFPQMGIRNDKTYITNEAAELAFWRNWAKERGYHK